MIQAVKLISQSGALCGVWDLSSSPYKRSRVSRSDGSDDSRFDGGEVDSTAVLISGRRSRAERW